MRVAIVRLGAFGDIIHTLPLAADLAAAGHTVGWLCEDRWACLIDGSPAVARIHRWPRKALRSAGLWRCGPLLRPLARELRAAGYDAVIDAQGLAKSALATLLSGAPRRIAHARPRARELTWLVPAERTPCSAVHVIDQQRALGGPLGGGAGPWRFPLPAWTGERERMARWLAERGLARSWMLNVGAGWPTKVWPLARQQAFAAACQDQGIPLVVVWGGPEERQVAEQVVVHGGILAPPTTLPELAGLLAGAGIVVSGDTGPLHLALAVGVPAVGLFGPVPAERNGPKGLGYRCLQAPGAAWERRDVSKVDMGAITVEQVLAAGRECLGER
jgi:heptosyltransferase-1